MPVICGNVVHSAVAHVAHVADATMRVVRHVTGPIGRHHVHSVIRAAHALAERPHRGWIQTACRVIPGTLAGVILAVPPSFIPARAVQSVIIPAPPMVSPAIGVLPGSSMLFFAPPAVTPPLELTPPNLVVSTFPPSGSTLGVTPQEVPEPDSTSVLILAIGSVILISRRRKYP